MLVRTLVVSAALVSLAALAHAVNDRAPTAQQVEDRESETAPPQVDGPPDAQPEPIARNATSDGTRTDGAPAARFEMPACDVPTEPTVDRPLGNPEAREAAQAGLDFLARETVAWQQQHQCFGCHVHTVTMEAFTVGRSHYYEVADTTFTSVLDGMLDLPGGGRTTEGFSYHGSSLFQPSRASGGAALARYDALVAGDDRPDLGDELLRAATQLLGHQRADGSIDLQYSNGRVFVGDVQGTAMAIETWNQAYARTADVSWNTAVQRAETWLRGRAEAWSSNGAASTQDLNYAIIGLVAAGVGSGEEVLVQLRDALLSRQQDGGGFVPTALVGQASAPEPWQMPANRVVNTPLPTAAGNADPLITGQSVYALRMLGFTDRDTPVAAGMRFLMARQSETGGWSAGGSSKAEAMWAILGLVTLDALTIDVDGVASGERVDGTRTLDVHAVDNQGGAVVQTEVFVDDVRVAGECAGDLRFDWDTRSLATGPHTVDVVATNASGTESRRRFTVFAGDVFVTRFGSRYEDGGTRFSLRNIGPEDQDGEVRLDVHRVTWESGAPVAGDIVWSDSVTGTQGATAFHWEGPTDANAADRRFIARVSYVRDGEVVQSEEAFFFHDTEAARRARYGSVSGMLQLEAGEAAANARVELVDELGNVVQSTWSTADGAYRFENLDDQRFSVRVRRDGFAPVDMPVAASPAEETEQNVQLTAE